MVLKDDTKFFHGIKRDTEWMPNCLANDILNVITKKEKYMKLVYDDEIDLGYAGNILTGHTNAIVWNQNMVGQ